MDDKQIIDLFWQRSEIAIAETSEKYGKYCYSIAYGILQNVEDSEECVSDTYMHAWDSMPPQRPQYLSGFLGKITRNLALNKCKYYSTERRGLGQVPLVLEELQECLSSNCNTEQMIEDEFFRKILNNFLEMQKPKVRKIFIRRYWYLSSIKEIAKDLKMSESSVKMTLMRTRNSLKEVLEKEGIWI